MCVQEDIVRPEVTTTPPVAVLPGSPPTATPNPLYGDSCKQIAATCQCIARMLVSMHSKDADVNA